MRTKQEKLERPNKSRIEILDEAEQGKCVTRCEEVAFLCT